MQWARGAKDGGICRAHPVESSPMPNFGFGLSSGGFWLGSFTGSCWMTKRDLGSSEALCCLGGCALPYPEMFSAACPSSSSLYMMTEAGSVKFAGWDNSARGLQVALFSSRASCTEPATFIEPARCALLEPLPNIETKNQNEKVLRWLVR